MKLCFSLCVFVCCVSLVMGLEPARKGSLPAGVGFEDGSDLGGSWNIGGKASCGVSDEYAFRGKKSMKMVFVGTGKEAIVVFTPAISDWSAYRQLRFTVYNSRPIPNEAFLQLFISDAKGADHSLPQNCAIPSGLLNLHPESARTFSLNLDEIKQKIDLKNVTKLKFYRNTVWPEAVCYIDEIKLFTADEVTFEETGKKSLEIAETVKDLKDNLSSANKSRGEEALSYISKLEALSQKVSSRDDPDLSKTLEGARCLLVVMNMLKANGQNGQDAKDELLLVSVPPTEKIFRHLPFQYSPEPFQLMAAGHEWQSFQIAAVAVKSKQNVMVEAEDLTLEGDPLKTISRENVTINPVAYVEVVRSFYYKDSHPGWWPDPLVKNQPLEISGRVQPYWITVYVPREQAPGNYKGKIKFATANGFSREVEYRLNVRAFSLPLRGRLTTFIGGGYQPPSSEIRRKCYDTYLDHRLNPISMYVNGSAGNGKPALIPMKEDLKYCLDKGLNRMVLWYLYNSENKQDPFSFDDAYLKKAADFVKGCKPLLEKLNCWDMAMVNGFDEVMHRPKDVREKRLKEAEKACSYFKNEFPDLKLCNVGKKMEISTKLMDVWFVTPVPDEETKDLRESDKEVGFYWVYEDPSFMLDLPGMAPRICSWMAYKYKAAGIGYYSSYRPVCAPEDAPAGVDWPKEKFSIETYSTKKDDLRPGRNGDGNLVYPCRDGSLLSSIRLENLRDGIQDYEYLAMLKELCPESPLLNIPDSIVTFKTSDYTRNYKLLNEYRCKVADEIERLSKKTK